MAARTFRLSNSLDSLQDLAAFIEAFTEDETVPMAAAMHLQLVVEEAVSNVIQHGFSAGGSEGSVTLERAGGSVRVEVVDDGPAFDPLSAPPPDVNTPLMERELGGLGIEMIRKLTDRQEYRRENGRNRLVMEKKLTE